MAQIIANNRAFLGLQNSLCYIDTTDGAKVFEFSRTPVLPTGMSFVRGPANGTGYANSSLGYLSSYSTNVPRFDFNGSTPFASRGLLIEGQRANLITNGTSFAAVGVWNNFSSGLVTPGATLGPDNSTTSTKFDEVTANTQHFIYWNRTSTNETISGYVVARAAERARIRVNFSNFATDSKGAFFDLDTGTIQLLETSGPDFTNISASIEPMQNSFYKCNITVTKGSANNVTRLCLNITQPGTNNTTYLGSAGNGMYFAYAGVEVNSFASSTIPTVGSSVTRAADILTAATSALNIPTLGTIIASFKIPQAAPTGIDQMLFQLSDGTDANRVSIRNKAGGLTIVPSKSVASVDTDGTSLGSMTAGTKFAVGLSFDSSGNVVATLNGGTVQTISSAPTSNTTLRIGNNVAGTAALSGWIMTARIYNRILSNGEMQALTLAASV